MLGVTHPIGGLVTEVGTDTPISLGSVWTNGVIKSLSLARNSISLKGRSAVAMEAVAGREAPSTWMDCPCASVMARFSNSSLDGTARISFFRVLQCGSLIDCIDHFQIIQRDQVPCTSEKIKS